MPITPSFTISTTSTVSTYRLTDTSTGSDVDLTHRTIYLYDVSNNLLVAAVTWAIDQDTYDFSLEYDIALNVVVHWAKAASATAYESDQIHAFLQFAKQFTEDLTQDQSINPAKLQDVNYMFNKLRFMCEIDSAENAISVGENLSASQQCIDRIRFMMSKSNLYF
jgi:hypothetical protein